MKNKNGFTLIELLAVVVIIAVLLLIAVPAVSKYLTKGTVKYYNNLEDNLVLAGREYLNDYPTLYPKEIENVTVIELNELTGNKYIDEIVDGSGNKCDGKVTVKKVNKNKYEYYTCLICDDYQTKEANCGFSEEDNVTSETKNYSIGGVNDKYTVDQGESFTLPVAKAYYLGQMVDSNIIGSPRIIDTNKIGTTTVIYSYKGQKKQITVEVKDVVAPSTPQIVLKYDNKNGNIYDGNWYSGSIYAEFKSTDYTKPGLNGSGVTDYYISIDKTNWQNVNGNSYTFDTDGNITYYVRSVDNFGNMSELNKFVIKKDTVTPTCTILANNNEVTGNWYSSDVTLSLNVKETPSGIINKSISQTSITSNTTAQGITVTGTVTSNSGKVGTCSAVIKLDKTRPNKPTITASDGILSVGWHNSDFNLSFSGASNVSGNTYYYGTTTNTTSTGAKTETISENTPGTAYYAKVCSGAGLCSDISSYQVKLDKIAPRAPTITGGSTTWSASSKTISVSTEASALSGISYYQYCISTSTSSCNGTWTNLAAGVTSVSISTNGIRYIYFRGISGSKVTGTASTYQTTKIDTGKLTAPTAKTLTYTGSAQSLVNAGSVSIGTIQYKLGSTGTYSTSIPTATNAGTYTVYYKVVGDSIHNDGVERPVTVTINKKAGSATLSATSGTVTAGQNISFTVSGATGTISCSSSSTSYAKCSVSGTTVTVTGVAAGTATITVNIAASTNYNATSKTYSVTIKSACSYAVGQTWNYAYTGGIQSFTVPCSGTYKLEVWGAQGGASSSGYTSEGGGYSYGNKILTSGSTLYIVVGGQTGYNGGGTCSILDPVDNFTCYSYGGGATHIATRTGLLSSLSSYRTNILIVAGGSGGSAYYYEKGGSGGGTTGGNPTYTYNNTTTRTDVLVGTQSTGYLFGQGQNGSTFQRYDVYGRLHTQCGGSGGGGYYGGYAGNANVPLCSNGYCVNNARSAGAGGSGYIGGVTAGSMQNGVRQGNGYTTITLISISQ